VYAVFTTELTQKIAHKVFITVLIQKIVNKVFTRLLTQKNSVWSVYHSVNMPLKQTFTVWLEDWKSANSACN
jgi:hypothetical protein